jgi:hypothetical protein
MLSREEWSKPKTRVTPWRSPPAKPSLLGFINFLDGKPVDEEYDYHDVTHCPVGKYAYSLGLSYFELIAALGGKPGPTHPANEVCGWNACITWPEPRTFGAAAERARKYQRRGW